MRIAAFIAITAGLAAPALAAVGEYQVRITNLAPANGTVLTPVWVGFHNGGFDTFDPSAAASPALERLAEDGNTADISSAFTTSGMGSVDATLRSDRAGMPPVLFPGETATRTFSLDSSSAANRFLSFLSMVVPSNDAFVGNNDPMALRLFSDTGEFLPLSRTLTGAMIWDAGTEVNDELAASTAFFGQSVPNTGEIQNGVITPHAGFLGSLNNPGTQRILADAGFSAADFTQTGYQVLRIEVTQVPAPGAAALLLTGLAFRRRAR